MKLVPCWNMDMLGYHNISYLINASIYLVKGGRLGLMPGVLFHSCCSSLDQRSEEHWPGGVNKDDPRAPETQGKKAYVRQM